MLFNLLTSLVAPQHGRAQVRFAYENEDSR